MSRIDPSQNPNVLEAVKLEKLRKEKQEKLRKENIAETKKVQKTKKTTVENQAEKIIRTNRKNSKFDTII